MTEHEAPGPSLDEIGRTREALAGYVRRTPVFELPMREIDSTWREETDAQFKLELLQITGTFKLRGALNVMQNLTPEQRQQGVTAVSAGNHAVAVAYAARALGISARVVMTRTANPLRVELTRAYGAEIDFCDDIAAAFRRVKEIETVEQRIFVHPFDGPRTVAGTATLGLEWFEQCRTMDAVVVAVGGGGLIAGVACAIRQLAPATTVYGVEPVGAAAMHDSFQAGRTVTLDAVRTLADSLGAPMTLPYTYGVCRQYVERIACVTDEAICAAMGVAFRGLKLAVEPAGAAALAAVLGPLRAELEGARRIGILVCGSNIDSQSYCRYLNE
jgi:threonine dehydratase